VLRDGAETEGQVCGLTAYGTPGGSVSDFGVKVRVRLPDGSTKEFEKGPLEARHVGQLFEGSVVPVRYDPAKPSRVALDVPALEAAQAQVRDGRQAQLDAQFEHLGEPGAATSGGGDLRAQIMQAVKGSGGVIDLRSSGKGGHGSDPADRVAKLAALKEQGLIDEAQFAAAKAQILGEK
jgi:hypothetical protein